MIFIYGLIERNAEVKGIRYIGLTNNPEYRLLDHPKEVGFPKGRS
jgi:predicted GIY-YIG superfamily endonuclease